jgi:hypothetical protein
MSGHFPFFLSQLFFKIVPYCWSGFDHILKEPIGQIGKFQVSLVFFLLQRRFSLPKKNDGLNEGFLTAG